MTLLNSKFDIDTHDPHPNALAGLMQVLEVKNPPAISPSGTPTPGVIGSGSIVIMDTDGKAILADNDDAKTHAPALFFVAVDGDMDLDGAFVHKVTCIQGGAEFTVENYVAAVYTPGQMLTCGHAAGSSIGQWRAAVSGEQIYGIVGPRGLNAIENTLDVFLPQGIAPALP